MKPSIMIFVAVFCLFACIGGNQKRSEEVWIKEIFDTEKRFAEMAASDGIPAAFAAFAAEDVVINRNDSLHIGKSALEKFYSKAKAANVQLTWKPDFADVSSSGDMAYTYGKYQYTVTDSVGNTKSYDGIFHTVWKRQNDGSWKFVWD